MKRFKNLFKIVIAAVMITDTIAGCGASKNAGTGSDTSKQAETKSIYIGSALYDFEDDFLSQVRTSIEKEGSRKGTTLEILDSQKQQTTQNEQIDKFIGKNVNALVITPVDRSNAGLLIQKAKEKNIPIVFINRQPSYVDMGTYDKVWYVGAQAEQSGLLQGRIIVDYFKANPKADKNSDGKVQYVMIEGEPEHQDAILRTEYSVKGIEDGGFKTQKLASNAAMWDKEKATAIMKEFIAGQGLDKIEAVLCNNDEMALGAIEALKAEGYNNGDAAKYIPVVGVDATAPALKAMKEGSFLGTVLNDATNQGRAAVNIALAAAQGKEITKENIDYEISDKKYIWINYVKITKENYKEYTR